MNATSLNELRAANAATAAREGADERMEQIRELLVGEQLRQQEARLAAIEGRLRDLEGLLFRRVDALSARIEALSAEASSHQRQAFDELSRMMGDLAESIRRIARS